MRPGRGGGGGSSRVPSVHFADPSLARDTLNIKLCRYNHPYRLLYHICNALYPNCMFHVRRHTDPRLGEGPLCTDCVSRLASTLQPSTFGCTIARVLPSSNPLFIPSRLSCIAWSRILHFCIDFTNDRQRALEIIESR